MGWRLVSGVLPIVDFGFSSAVMMGFGSKKQLQKRQAPSTKKLLKYFLTSSPKIPEYFKLPKHISGLIFKLRSDRELTESFKNTTKNLKDFLTQCTNNDKLLFKILLKLIFDPVLLSTGYFEKNKTLEDVSLGKQSRKLY